MAIRTIPGGKGATCLYLGAFVLALGCGEEPNKDDSSFEGQAGTGGPVAGIGSVAGTGGFAGSTGVQAGTGAAAAGETGGPMGMAGTGGSMGMAGTGGSMGGEGTGTWCDALAVFRTSCQTCHAAELVGGAPMPLVTYEDTQAPGISDPSKAMHELIGERIHDDANPMPPLSQDPLTAEQVAAVDAWLEAGAPNATGECSDLPDGPMEQEFEWPEDCDEKYEIRASDGRGGPYIVGANVEEQRDFEVPVPWTGEAQAVAIRPITNNKRVVHHWILYHGAFDFVTSWSPGKPPETFPDGVGVYMPSSGTFRLQMHYFNVGNDEDEPDTSGLEVCITRNPRPNSATTHMFSASATVPANSEVSNSSTCDVQTTEPVHLITSSPHMHSYGVGAKLEIIRQDGTVEVLEDSAFNWEDQHVTPIDAVIETGDQVRTTCEYVNTTPRTIRFGNSSEDEMCFNFARYYPRGALTCRGGGLFP